MKCLVSKELILCQQITKNLLFSLSVFLCIRKRDSQRKNISKQLTRQLSNTKITLYHVQKNNTKFIPVLRFIFYKYFASKNVSLH